ncbi:MAG: M50 family metallopeptidase [Alteromonadaceae bacterium]|nr:M50 family metallopeptidase [Alteromonadaceae bacterium]
MQKYQFWLFLLAAVVLRQIPFISIPFNWLETYFHEISHGIAALLSGGRIIKIELFANGAGLCTTQGGNRFFVSFSGYAGAIVWGTMIYISAKSHQRIAQILSTFIIILLFITLALWARDLLTIFICIVLLALFLLSLKTKNLKTLQLLLQLFGMVVLLNSIYSPFYLLDGRAIGDGASLANLTLLPEFVWVIIWSSLGLATLYFLAKKS